MKTSDKIIVGLLVLNYWLDLKIAERRGYVNGYADATTTWIDVRRNVLGGIRGN